MEPEPCSQDAHLSVLLVSSGGQTKEQPPTNFNGGGYHP